MAIIEGKITCSTCRTSKTLDCFSPSRIAKGVGDCRACANRKRAEWGAKNRDRENAYKRAWVENNPDKAREMWRKAHHKNREVRNAKSSARYHGNKERAWAGFIEARYGITADEYEERLKKQGGGCACCGVKENGSGRRLFVDHCHETGRIRGILCHNCNAGIGALGDNIAGLKRALEYLKGA